MAIVSTIAGDGTYLFYTTSVIFALATFGYCVYQYFFHPLAKYPGPFLSKFSYLYTIYHAWKGNMFTDLYNCHEKYGDYVRYAPNRLSINNSEALRVVYREGKNFTKAQNYHYLSHTASNTFVLWDKQEHAPKRRAMASLCSDSAVRRYEPIIIANIRKLVHALKSDKENEMANGNSMRAFTKPKDLAHWINYCNLDTLTETFFGVNYGFVETPSIHYICNAVSECKKRISVLVHLPILYLLTPIDRLLFPHGGVARSHFITFIIRLMKDCKRLKKKTSICTVLSEATRRDGEQLFTSKQVMSEIINLSIAGVDTTTHALSAAFFYLSLPENRATYERVTKEVRSTFSSIEDVRLGAELNSCTYMRACIDEAMRLSPPGASAPFRNVLKGGAIIEGQYFPEGVDIGVPIYSIHHNPAYYFEPFSFKPERWLTTETSVAAVERAQSAHCPFMYGARGCVGRAVAVAQSKLTLAMVLVATDFELDAGDKSGRFSRPNEFFVREHITSLTKGPMMKFRAVETQP